MRISRYVLFSSFLLITSSALYVLAGADKNRDDFCKGIDYTNQGKYDLAIQKFTEIITENKDYANAYMALGIVYINKKMPEEAVQLLEKAAELDPSNKRVFFMLARLYEKTDETKALATWEKYISLDPEPKFKKIARKHIDRLTGKVDNDE
ncbi:MAG: tetratricopeptide repeat protein [Elusimicrobia bacterium]|nr:tetratricopeptide repeat protein [Elusimicrobiota bacterium]